jgi:Tol biopolymer transport system component
LRISKSGRRTQVTDLELTRAYWWFLWPRFSDDGQRVIFHLPRRADPATKLDVWSVPVNGGKPELVLRDASFPVPFPDGKTIAFVPGAQGFSGQSIAIADLDASRRRTLVEATDAIWWPAISPDGTRIAYVDGTTAWDSFGSVHVVEVSTGASTKVADGRTAEWLDDDTLIVNPESTPPNASP